VPASVKYLSIPTKQISLSSQRTIQRISLPVELHAKEAFRLDLKKRFCIFKLLYVINYNGMLFNKLVVTELVKNS